MKAINILSIYDSLVILADKDLDLNIACDIAKNLQTLTVPKQVIEQKRDKLILKYAEKDDNEQIIQNENGGIKITNEPEFQREFNDLIESDIELDLIKIKKSDLGDIKISPKVILGMIDILED